MAKSKPNAAVVSEDAQSAEDLNIPELDEDGGSDEITELREQIDQLNARVDALSEELSSRPEIAPPGAAPRPQPRPAPTGPNVPLMVRATAVGLYGRIRQPNEKFQIMSHGFSDLWMEKVEAEE